MIRHKKNKFYVEIFNPEHTWKYMGRIIESKDGKKIFCIHFKKPDKHFYIKGRGYPINTELLQNLQGIHIYHILIPEKGKTGFHCYVAKTQEYLKGTHIREPLTEAQMVIPLSDLEQIKIEENELRGILHE